MIGIVLEGGPLDTRRFVVEDNVQRQIYPAINENIFETFPWEHIGQNQLYKQLIYEKTDVTRNGLVVFEFRE
jgi:hypothetical protein